MASLRDRVILLSRTPFGESSLVVQGISARHGRLSWMAKGAYRASSRFYCVLDLCDTLELEWQTAQGSDLHTLRAGSLLVRRAGLCADPRRFRAAMVLTELADLVSRAGQPEPGLFASLERGLDALLDLQGSPDWAQARFELELLSELGLLPSLEQCAACGRAAPPVRTEPHSPAKSRAAFSASGGGRLCPACARLLRAQGRRVGTMPLEVLEDARLVLGKGSAAAQLAGERLLKVRDLLERFLGYHLDTRPRSLSGFLAAPQRNAPAS